MHIPWMKVLESLPYFIGETTEAHGDESTYPRRPRSCVTQTHGCVISRRHPVNVKEADGDSFFHPLNK